MCSNRQEMFYIISKLEDCLKSQLSNSLCVGGFKLYRVSKDHKVGDYICYASNRQCALPPPDVLEMKLFELLPSIRDIIKVTVAPHGFSISLSRNNCFMSGLRDLQLLGDKYGFNTEFSTKAFTFSIMRKKNESDALNNLRLQLASEVLNNLVLSCGGTIDIEGGCKREISKIEITNRNISDDGFINLLVGPVICDCTEANLELYKSKRMEEICTMCEQRLGDLVILKDKNEVLKTTMLFDLLQSNIWRSVRLNIMEKDTDKRSSCKGAVFVLYNYARLYSLCSRFDDEVSAGIYPVLPPLKDIDASLLSLEDEWILMFDSILTWPTLLQKAIVDIKEGRPKLHLIFDFLKKMANDFSLYYHRTKILTEPRIHLLPVLFARMHLLKTLLQLYQILFKIIGVSPLEKM